MALPLLVQTEQVVLDRTVTALRAVQSADKAREEDLLQRARQAHRDWTDARGDIAQREAFEEALAEAKRGLDAHRNAKKSRELPVGNPYFGRIVLKEEKRKQEVLIGKIGVVEKGLNICDWRDAPISKLYYSYEEGEEYCEEIGRFEREGIIATKRRVDIREGVIVEVQGGKELMRLRPDGAYSTPGRARPEGNDDHRLPDIVSLITKEQFHVITRTDAGVVLLRGRAGSGKTTVALHRIAYLHFQDSRRFRPERMLVVMFNKALQTYISRVLPDLGISGVPVETFHGWAGRLLRSTGMDLEFQSQIPVAVARLKRHPAIGALLQAHIAQLGEKSASWLENHLEGAERTLWNQIDGKGLARVAAFRQRAGEGNWWGRLRMRLMDHPKDLWTLFEDEALCRQILPRSLHATLSAARKHEADAMARRVLDWEDAALLLRLGQLKSQADSGLNCLWNGLYSHIVIDEAQDLSTLEIEVLVDAADAGRSVTIAGDPAQKILADAQFEGFEQLLSRLGNQVSVRLDALAVGHRSTRPIMELALVALDQLNVSDPAVIAARDGEPVAFLEGEDAFMAAVAAINEFRVAHPTALVAVLAKGKTTADDWSKKLVNAGVLGVRRAARSDFSFVPGVVVSNVHQVKGLEFDGVVLVEPTDFNSNDRHLLHVALTRAAERLWIVASRGRGLLAV